MHDPTTYAMAVAGKSIFVREATGLVREFSWLNALIISVSAIGPGIFGPASQIAFVSGADPGADIAQTVNLGLIFLIPLVVVYYLLAASMPRSGGDYVWVSRLVNPVLGFLVGWGFWIVLLTFIGTEAYLFSVLVLPVFFASFGLATLNPFLISLASTVSAPVSVFIIGLILLIFISTIGALGPRIFSRVLFVLFTLMTISLLVAYFVLASSTHSDFVAALNGFGGTNVTFSGIIAQAQKGGWSPTPIALAPTLLGTPLGVILIGFSNAGGASFAGEVKTIKRSMLAAIIGALVVSWLFDVVGIVLSMNVFGYDFVQATISVSSSWPFPAPPWLPFIITPLVHNNAILSLIQVGWLLNLPLSMAAWAFVCTRYVFAISFDRVFPVRLADISDRFHFPVKAAFANFVVAFVFFLLAAFTPYLGLWLNAVAIASLVWAVGSVAAIVLPYKKRELASSLPGGHWKIPLITILGTVSLLGMLVNFYWDVTTPAIGPSTPQADAILAGILIIGLVVYFASYFFRRKQGVDLNLIYSEIPPE